MSLRTKSVQDRQNLIVKGRGLRTGGGVVLQSAAEKLEFFVEQECIDPFLHLTAFPGKGFRFFRFRRGPAETFQGMKRVAVPEIEKGRTAPLRQIRPVLEQPEAGIGFQKTVFPPGLRRVKIAEDLVGFRLLLQKKRKLAGLPVIIKKGQDPGQREGSPSRKKVLRA